MKIVFEELWEWDIEINNLSPSLDPLTINTNIIIIEDKDINGIMYDKVKYNVIRNNSKLNNIIIILFRHQHILKILSNIIIIIKFIWRIFYIQSRYFNKLFRTFGNSNIFVWNFICN